ncbi:MAG: hypothetical protein ABGX00_03205 [Allomuricauda sp.]|jgi:tetratricopeptide (TPR) repeat protein
MKHLLYITFLLCSFSIFPQKSETNELLEKGNDAFINNDFETAQILYSKILQIDSINNDAIFNLAITNLNLGNNSEGCNLLQKAYKLRDENVGEFILEYCGEIEYNENMFSKDVDELPKFKDGSEVYDLITEKGINPILFKKFEERANESRILRKVKNGKVYVMLKIGIDGKLDSRTTGPDSSLEINREIKTIFQEIAEYIPCKYKNRPVGMFDSFWLPISF